ncbi:hypothetical protein EXIGLDRAFT_844089 [Exidia glandulosa HHB12029]|uniref:Uncharacterized protein n=1 Tax=Exidia glandulosa HHB12029 TaxID=1314781 RepID=A0A165C984_EXIGL|nr:hypothetical protein EXIGLDRAFT_844089 [Exidia glandulosa HHB12029]
MASADSFGPNTTLIKFPWPQGITGLERVLLSAHGDLQRILSAYFAHQIDAEVVTAHTCYSHSRDDEEGKALPLTQRRVVNLLCGTTVVCQATSTIVVSSREVADLFDQGYFIGQVVRKLQQTPAFNLLSVGVKDIDDTPGSPASDSDSELSDSSVSGSTGSSSSSSKQRLWRKYVLRIEGLECNIEEIFVDRDMFLSGNVSV